MRPTHKKPLLASLNGRIARGVPLISALVLLAACDGATEPVSTPTLRVPTNIEAVSPTTLVGTVETEVGEPPTVRVTDQDRGAMQNIEVLFSTIRYHGVPAHTSVRTDANGIATAPWRLSSRAGTQTLRAVLGQVYGSAPAAEFTANAMAGPPASVTALIGSQVTMRGSVASLRARVADAYGNPISGVLVSFAIESGAGSLASPSAYTDSLGVAHGAWTVGAGDNSVVATVPGLVPARFAATILDTPVYYELTSMGGPPLAPSWIELGVDGRFTTSFKGVEGTGSYTIAEGRITFGYSTDFLTRLASTFNWWVYPYSMSHETGDLTEHTLVLRRCWSDECYEYDWTFQRRAR